MSLRLRLLWLVCLLGVGLSSSAQHHQNTASVVFQDSDSIMIYRIEYDTPNDMGIRYYLPDTVKKVLSTLINKTKKRGAYLLELSEVDNRRYMLSFVSFNPDSQRNKDLLLVSKSTNRYVLLNDMHIPLYFSLDHYFAFPNYILNSDYYIIFSGHKSQQGTIHSITTH